MAINGRTSGSVPGSTWQDTESVIPNEGYAPPEEVLAKLKRPLSVQPLRDLPVNVHPAWDNVHLVTKSLTALEWGQFLSASLLADAMGRDDRIQGAFTTRTSGLIGLPFEMRPADDSGKAVKVAEEATELWPGMVNEAQLAQILETGIMMGVAIVEKIWTLGPDKWVPHLRFWHPSFYYWRWDTRSYWLITQDGQIEVPEDGGGRFFVYCPYGYYRGWMKGRIRSLPLPWLIRSFTRRDWSRQTEVFGNTIKKAIVPSEAPIGDRQRFTASLANMGSEGLIECPVIPNRNGEEGPGIRFDLELVEAKSRTWDSFKDLIGHAEAAISIAILGQTLTTEVKSGSKAAAQVHESILGTYAKMDATTLSRTLRQGMLAEWCQYNYGDRGLAPIPHWETEPPEDVNAKATALNQASQAYSTFVEAGLPIDPDAFASEMGIPLLPESERPTPEEIAEKQAAAAQAAAAAMQPPAPAEDPEADPKDPKDPKADPKGDDEKKPAPAKKKAKLSLGTNIGPVSRAQAYADAVADKALARSRAAMQRRIALLTQVVATAEDAADLKRKLVVAFDHPRDSDLADLVKKAQLMAELAGRSSVLEEG